MGVVRQIGGLVTGIALSNIVVAATEWVGLRSIHIPQRPGDLDPAAMAAWMADVPLSFKMLVVAGWLLGAIVGPWLTLRITDRAWTGWAVTAVFLAGTAVSLFVLPYPAWMTACGIVLPLAGGGVAQSAHRKPYAGEALLG